MEDYNTWLYKGNIKVDTTPTGHNVLNSVTNFPILVRLNSSNFDFSKSMTNGEDVRFSDSNGNHLSYEIERWDSVNELAEVWVKLDTVLGNNNTQFFTMYWGKTGATDNSDGVAVFDTADGFEGVWHLDEVGGTFADATSNANTGSDNVSDTGKTGVVGGGQDFDGVDDYIAIARPVEDDYTISFWMKANGNSLGGGKWYYGNGLVDAETPGAADDFGVSFIDNKIGHGTGNPDMTLLSSVTVNDAAWHHVSVTRVRSTGAKEVFVDGVSAGTQIGGNNSLTAPTNMRFGSLQTNIKFFDGSLDEIQISSIQRSADYIKLSYETQKPGVYVDIDVTALTKRRIIIC